MDEYLYRFVAWAKLKIRLHIAVSNPVYFREREIWWASLGTNIGHEQDGKNDKFERPVLIIKKFNQHLAWIVPLTTKNKTGEYYYPFEHDGGKYSLILSQIRTVSTKRLIRKLRMFPGDDFEEVRNKLKNML